MRPETRDHETGDPRPAMEITSGSGRACRGRRQGRLAEAATKVSMSHVPPAGLGSQVSGLPHQVSGLRSTPRSRAISQKRISRLKPAGEWDILIYILPARADD